MKILIIEDEPDLISSMADYLHSAQYTCELASDYDTALEKTELYDYDCILLDITLPGGNGLNILKNLKANNKEDGVLIISAKNSVDDKITGLRLGADDYLQKPFHLSELAARIAAIIRRRTFGGSDLINVGDLNIDVRTRVVTYNTHVIDLTRKEYDLFMYFVSNKNRVISKSAIAEYVWGDGMDLSENFDLIYTHIKNIRRKFIAVGAPEYLKSIYGVGYRFSGQ